MLRSVSLSSGTHNSAATDGVDALISETKSIIGVRYKVSGSEILPELSKELDKIKS